MNDSDDRIQHWNLPKSFCWIEASQNLFALQEFTTRIFEFIIQDIELNRQQIPNQTYLIFHEFQSKKNIVHILLKILKVFPKLTMEKWKVWTEMTFDSIHHVKLNFTLLNEFSQVLIHQLSAGKIKKIHCFSAPKLATHLIIITRYKHLMHHQDRRK